MPTRFDTVYTIAPANGQTRICLDPWSKVFVRSTGDVCMCCNAPPVGSLLDGPLDDILNSDEAISYRTGLLSGNVKDACANCPDRPCGSTEELKKHVQNYVDNDIMINP